MSPNNMLDVIADHPKVSQGVAVTTTGVSGAVQYVERANGLPVELFSFIGLIVGIIGSILVIIANVRRIRHESKMNKLDLELKRLRLDKEKRREQGLPMRRADD